MRRCRGPSAPRVQRPWWPLSLTHWWRGRIRTFHPSWDQCLSELVELCAETTWRAQGEFLRGGNNGSNPSPSCGESYKFDHGGRSEIVLRLRLDQGPRPRIKDAHHCCNVAQEPAPTTPSSRRVWRLAGGWNPSKNSVSVSPWPGCPSISHTEQFPGFRCCPYHFSAEIRKQEPG